MRKSVDEAKKVVEWFYGEGANLVREVFGIVKHSIDNGRKILICGNGGSASQSSHLAGELVGKFSSKRKPLPAIDLTSTNAVITSISNDFSFEEVFSRQVQALGNEGDVLLALSTSGKSKNVNNAVLTAKKKGMNVIYLCGEDGNDVEEYCDIVVKIPSRNTARIQEGHLLFIHLLCEQIEDAQR